VEIPEDALPDEAFSELMQWNTKNQDVAFFEFGNEFPVAHERQFWWK
jgi:hypothetical protein